MTKKIQPGATRDALAALSEHTRGGQPFTARELQARLGVSPAIAAERLRALALLGYATQTSPSDDGDRPREYAITDLGRSLL